MLGLFAPVGIHQVAHSLQRVKGDTHGQQEVERRRSDLHAQMRQHRQHGFGEKAQIFEPDQRGQGQQDACRQHTLAGLALQQAAAEIAHGGDKSQHRDMGRVPAEIEEIAGQQQPGPPGLLGHRKIPQRRQRQKQQKLCRIENHRYSSSNLFWLPLGGSWLREAQTEGETICLAAANFFVSPPPASRDCLRNRPLCRCATSPHGVGSYPRRGGHCSGMLLFYP